MAIRLGVQLHPQHTTYDALAKAAQEVDAQGFDTLWTWDHFYPLYGEEGAPMGPDAGADPGDLRGAHFEGWSLLTAFACLTKKVEIGMLVTCNTYRNIQLLADMARTVDHISHGRFMLGIGSGWFQRDYDEYGYPFGTAASRLTELGKALPVLVDRLGKLNPQPVRNPMPIVIGGGGEKVTLKLVAQYATIWNYFAAPDEMAHKMRVLDDWCAKVGRNPAEIERSILIARPDAMHHLDAYYDVGIRHFILGMGIPFDFSHAQQLREWRDKKMAHT